MSYGLCSTCTRDIRSGLVKNNRPYLFFCTNYKGERHLAGYYHIGWFSLGPRFSPTTGTAAFGTTTVSWRTR